jgi:hypothetical protein
MIQQVLRLIVLGVFFLINPIATAYSYGVYETHPYKFLINKSISNFSENYFIYAPSEVNSSYPNTYPGKIKKSAFRIRTNYDLSNQNGWQATGITRILSLGAIYPWATDIDIYDTRGVEIGLINGNIATLEAAKFDIYSYDESGNATIVGVATANADFTDFSITTPGNYLPIAELRRNKNKNTWTTTVITPEIIDDRIIRIFSGFVIDYQNIFLAHEE